MNAGATRNVFWSGLEAAVSGLLSFVSVCVVARLVGPSELGFGAAAVAVQVLLWVAVNALFADALVQRNATDADTVASALWASTGVGVVAALVQAAAGWPLAAWLGDSRLLPMCVLLALPLPLVGAAGPVQGVLTLHRAYRALAWRTIVGQGLGTLAGIAAAMAQAGAWAPVLQQFVISAAGAAALLAGARLRPRLVIRWSVVRALLRVGLPLTTSTLVLTGRYRLFAVVIGGTAGSATLGRVHMAFRLVETVRELASTAQWRLMLPVLAERQHDPRALLAAVDRLLAASSRAVLPLCGAMALAMPPLVRLVLGPAWTASGRAGEPLIALMALLMLIFPASVAVVARGDTARVLAGNVLAAALTAGGVLLLRPTDPFGAALLWMGAQLVVAPYSLWLAARALGTGLLRPLRSGMVAAAVTLCGGAAAVLLIGAGSPAWLTVERLAVFAVIVLWGIGAAAAFTMERDEPRGRTLAAPASMPRAL